MIHDKQQKYASNSAHFVPEYAIGRAGRIDDGDFAAAPECVS